MDWPQKGPTEIFETFHSYKSSFNLVISINIITCFPFRPYSELQNLVPFHVFHMIPLMLIPDALGTRKSWTLPTWRDARDVADWAHHRGGPGGLAGTGRRGEFALGAQRRHRALPRGSGAEPAPAGGSADRDRDGRQGSPFRNAFGMDQITINELFLSYFILWNAIFRLGWRCSTTSYFGMNTMEIP